MVLSRSLVFSHLLVSKLCCGNITLHAADLIPNCAKHCLFTSKCLLSVSRPMFFLFLNSQLIPSCTKQCVSTGKCNLCASRPIFLFPNSQPTGISNCKKKCFHRYMLHVSLVPFFPNSVSYWVLQPRIAPVCIVAGTGSGSTGFRRRFRRFWRRSGRFWCRARSRSTGFRRRFRRRFWRRSGKLWCRARSGPEKVPGGLGAKPTQLQQGSGEGSGELEKVLVKVWEALVQSSTGFRRKIPEKVWEALVES